MKSKLKKLKKEFQDLKKNMDRLKELELELNQLNSSGKGYI